VQLVAALRFASFDDKSIDWILLKLFQAYPYIVRVHEGNQRILTVPGRRCLLLLRRLERRLAAAVRLYQGLTLHEHMRMDASFERIEEMAQSLHCSST
jgi:hypothetical protein